MNHYLSFKLKFLSFVSIVMVVISHANSTSVNFAGGSLQISKSSISFFVQTFLSTTIARVSLPFFILISGYLFFLNIRPSFITFKEKFIKRLRTVFLPFFIWSLWGIVVYYLLQTIPYSKPFFANDLVKDYSILRLIDTLFINPLPYQLWFLRDLLYLVIISPVILIFVRKFKIGFILMMFLIWFNDISIMPGMHVDSLFFFSIGCYFSIFQSIYITENSNKRINLLFFITWFSLCLLNTYLISMDQELSWDHFITKACTLLTIVFIWRSYDKISDVIPRNLDVFSFTFFIFAAHEPLLTIQKKVLTFLIGFDEGRSFIIYLFSSILTILITIYIGKIIRKYIPYLYNVITGGR